VADLVSQTMLGCSRAREQMRDSGAFRSFLISCAMNKLRMYYRTKVKRRRELDDFEDICVAPSDDGHTPMSVVALRRDSQLLVRALKKMPLDQQIVFELKYFEDLNGVEIANLLGVPTQTVYTRLRRGTQKIRAMVAELAESPELAQSTMTGLQTWAEQIRDEFAS
nr:sigma-70 family RNA polymerase sigma factor [Deltaproteobacteria bacterium]